MHGTKSLKFIDAKQENRFSGQNRKNANSQTKKNKTTRNQITAKNVPKRVGSILM